MSEATMVRKTKDRALDFSQYIDIRSFCREGYGRGRERGSSVQSGTA